MLTLKACATMQKRVCVCVCVNMHVGACGYVCAMAEATESWFPHLGAGDETQDVRCRTIIVLLTEATMWNGCLLREDCIRKMCYSSWEDSQVSTGFGMQTQGPQFRFPTPM